MDGCDEVGRYLRYLGVLFVNKQRVIFTGKNHGLISILYTYASSSKDCC